MPKGPDKRKTPDHGHPGGSGAVFGVRVLRNTGIQGLTLILGNLIQLVSVLVVAGYLGPDEMGRYALLLFLAGLTTQVLSLLVKPGTIRRTFGGGDDDDDDDDDDAVSSSPPLTLGTGLAWAAVLGVLGTAAIYLLRDPIADGLLGDAGSAEMVAWAGVLAGFWLVFKIADITLWLERRPKAFLVADTARPVLGLAGLVAFLASGAGVEGAIAGTALGTAAAAGVALVLLRGSFEPGLNLGEVKQIILRGGHRAPIVMSFWLVQNADVFILSRFVSDTDLGIYALASRLGFVVSFLPQGFRMAMRPLRKAAVFEAFKEEYGKRTAQGQLLGYFALLCIFAVLVMVLGGEILVGIAPESYADAAPLIPFTAAAFVMPSLYRTVNQNVNVPNKRPRFILGTVSAALLFVGLASLLADPIGVYAAPVAMLVGFAVPASYLFIRGQRGSNPLVFPYRGVIVATLCAAAIAGAFALLPDLATAWELLIAAVLVGLWVALIVVLRVIPEIHREPLIHTVRSLASGTPARVNPRRGLRALEAPERKRLRRAVKRGMTLEELEGGENGGGDGAELVALLRRAAAGAGVPVGGDTSHDARIAAFLFEDASTAVRNASMRKVLAEGADANELRALEDLVQQLRRAPNDVWKGRKAGGRKRNAG